jgi:type III pantothenate kinase
MRRYNLVIDIGNSNIVAALYHNLEMKLKVRTVTVKENSEKIYHDFFQMNFGRFFHKIENIAISSVVPELTRQIITLFDNEKSNIWEIDYRADLGLNYIMKDSSHLGSDLVVNAYAAIKKYNQNCIICDLGTATTVQLVSRNNCFLGAAIVPGIRISSDCLIQSASKLSPVELQSPEKLLGTNTREALLSGIVNGHRFLLEGFISAIRKEYSQFSECLVIATGGLAEMVCSKSVFIDVIDADLLLDGLNIFCNSKYE